MTASARASMSAPIEAAAEAVAIAIPGVPVGAAGEALGRNDPGVQEPGDCGFNVQRVDAPGAQAAMVAAAMPAAPMTPRRRNPRRSSDDSSSFVIGAWWPTGLSRDSD